ncbi:MAG: Recombinase [Solirubrobacteraceae bacterium]
MMPSCSYVGNDAPEGCERDAAKGWTTCLRHHSAGRARTRQVHLPPILADRYLAGMPSDEEQRRRIREGMARSPATAGRRAALPEATERLILQLRSEGHGYRAIAQQLTDLDIPTAQGGKWTHSTVAKVLQRLEREE